MKLSGSLVIQAEYSLSETAEILENILGVKFTFDETSISPNNYYTYVLGTCIELVGAENLFYDLIGNKHQKYTLIIHELVNHESKNVIDISQRLQKLIKSHEIRPLKTHLL